MWQKFCVLTVCQFIVLFPLGVIGSVNLSSGAAWKHVCLRGSGWQVGERNFTQMVGVGVRLKRREMGEIPRALEKEETQRGTG